MARFVKVAIGQLGPIARSQTRAQLVQRPGHAEHEPWRRFQHPEKRYFEAGKDLWAMRLHEVRRLRG